MLVNTNSLSVLDLQSVATALLVCEQADARGPAQPQQATGVVEAPPQTTTAPGEPKADQLPAFKVLLHNDNVNDMLYVVRAILELTPLNKERALEVMFEAHTSGLALVLVTHKERAELYQDQFRSKKLKATIEPA